MSNFINYLMSLLKRKKLFQQISDYPPEYIQCCIEQDLSIAALESYLHTSDDPTEIAIQTLKTACSFYGGDWAGLFEIDMDLGIWSPVWWYKVGKNDRTMQMVREFESLTDMPTWIKSMQTGECVVIPDSSNPHAAPSQEAEVYRRLFVKSVIAAPFMPSPTGFFVIRNPSRYINYTTMLTVLAYVLHRAMAQQKVMNSTRMLLSPKSIRSDKDIIINFFGNMEICTSKGVLRESDFKSPKSSRVATYLMLHRKAAHPPLEIASALWPEDTADPDSISSNIRGFIYRFRQAFSLISDYQLIESTPNGYRINPKLHVMTDLQQFDELWESAQKAITTLQKIELLKQAFTLYRGPVFENAAGEHWIMSLATHYALRYTGLVNELLSTLAAVEDYATLQQYAVKAYEIMPTNVRTRYWIIYAMYQMGAIEMARNEITHAHTDFSAEEFDTLVGYIKECHDPKMKDILR